MRAARLHEYGKPFQIEDVPDPEPGPGEVLVRIGGAGVCHSDLHIAHGEVPGVLDGPTILGHENAGWVEALGPGATGFEPGEAVIVYGGWGCGMCRVCMSGEEQLCDTMRWGGLGPPGGYAERYVVPSPRHLIRIGDLDPADVAPLTDAGLTPYRAVKKVAGRLVGGDSALVIGAGGLGQMAIQFLGLLTPARIVVADVSPDKRQAALDLGADAVVDPARAGRRPGAAGRDGRAGRRGRHRPRRLRREPRVRRSVPRVQGPSRRRRPRGRHGAVQLLHVAARVGPDGSNWGTRTELEEVVALALQDRLVLQVERAPLDAINDVLARLEAGQVAGRAVLVP